MRIEIVAFDGMDEMDAVVPFEVLRNGARLGGSWDVALVGVRGPGPITGSHGLQLRVEAALGTPDAIVVPGGGWNDRATAGAWHEAQEGDLPARLRELAPACAWVASVCTGALLLAAAGLTKGRPATTHHQAHEALRGSGAELIADARVVDDGDLLACAGVTAGLDLSLWLIERELGAAAAAQVSTELEYERRGGVWRAPALTPGDALTPGERPRRR